jgi:hypothetical protein
MYSVTIQVSADHALLCDVWDGGVRALVLFSLKNKRGISTILASLLMVVIVTAASALVYVYSTSLLGNLLVSPAISTEGLSIENYSFAPTNNNVTLYLRNTGTTLVRLVSYYVLDSAGNQYSRTTWAGPLIPPQAVGFVSVPISSACVGCTTQGTQFTFQSGNAYNVVLITSKNLRFIFTVVR